MLGIAQLPPSCDRVGVCTVMGDIIPFSKNILFKHTKYQGYKRKNRPKTKRKFN